MWRAVLIGTNSYDDSSAFAPLKYAINDIRDVQSLISDPKIGEFDPKLVTSFEDAPHTAVSEGLERVLRAVSNKDSVFIYFAGHGKADRTGRLCLAAKNTSSGALIATSLHLEQVRVMIQSSEATRIVLVLDCCFGGAVGESLRGSELPGNSFESLSGAGKVIISSCGEFERSRERDDLQHGVFTHFLLEGLRTGDADANKDGRIGIEELFEYVRTRMRNLVADQTPRKWGEDQTGDIYIAKSARVLRQKEEESLETKKEQLLKWYLSGSLSPDIYGRAVLLLDLEPEAGGEKDRLLLRVLEDSLAGRIDLDVFVQSWVRIEKPNAKDDARVAFEQAQSKDAEDVWHDYLQRFKGVTKENDRVAQQKLEQCQKRREEALRVEDEAYRGAEAEDTPEAWGNFLRDHPQSPRKPEVMKKLVLLGGQNRAEAANKAFERAQRADTVAAWQSYLERWGGASDQHDHQAKERLQALRGQQAEIQAYEVARQRGQSEDWLKFLLEFPASSRRGEVLRALSRLPSPLPSTDVSPLRRVGADVIDYLLVVSALILFIAVEVWIESDLFLIMLSPVLASTVICVPYSFFVFKTGKVLGHKITGTRIAEKRGNPLTYGRSIGYAGALGLWWVFWFYLDYLITFAGAVPFLFGIELGYLTRTGVLLTVAIVAIVAPILSTALFAYKTDPHVTAYELLAGTVTVLETRRELLAHTHALNPGPWRRLTADLVDAGSLILAGFSLAALMGLLQEASSQSSIGWFQRATDKFSQLALFLTKPYSLLFFTLLWFCYYALFFTRFGQTLGSAIMGFRFLQKDRGAPGWSNAVRYAVCLLVTCVCAFYLVVPPTWIHLRWVLALPLIAFLVNPLLVPRRRHTLFDLLAGTQALRLQLTTP